MAVERHSRVALIEPGAKPRLRFPLALKRQQHDIEPSRRRTVRIENELTGWRLHPIPGELHVAPRRHERLAAPGVSQAFDVEVRNPASAGHKRYSSAVW